MTSWQDPDDRQGRGRTALDPAAGRPLSRREAREAERRAAEAGQERQPHPSGVVDFEAHDFSADFTPDQEVSVGDTQDIWAALTRGAGRPPADGAGSRPGAAGGSAVNGELLDRVREAVLRRQEQHPDAPAQAGSSRRERRIRETADLREDDLPADLFAERPAPAAPVPPTPRAQRPATPAQSWPAQPAPAQSWAAQPVPPAQAWAEQPAPADGADEHGADEYGADDYDDDAYYDEPYAPEPTAAIRSLRPMGLDQPSSGASPAALPQSLAEPTGDDALTFSSPVPTVGADPYDVSDEAEAAPAFLEPQRPAQPRRPAWTRQEAWSVEPDAWDEDDAAAAQQPAWPAQPAPATPPAFLPPQQARFTEPEVGPPSEVTDLAGFEALIRKARQQPAAPQPPQRAAAPAWADEEDVQEGFTGLLSRSVQGSHGSSNALILPNDPQPDLTQAVQGNGDIFITGSMNLPRSLSTNGTTAGHESHEVDGLFDGSHDEHTPGVAPVRAARAVSGTGESQVIGNVKRGRGTLLPTVLALVAGGMALSVLALLVGSWLLRLF